MKYLIATFAFFITLGLTTQSTANEPEACTPQNAEKTCTPATTTHGSSQTDQSDEMNSLFPEKQPLTELTAQPSVVKLMSPKFLEKITGATKLEWSAAHGANAYHIQIATDPNFKWLVADEHFVKTNSFEFAKAEAGNKYFWRVAAVNTDNDSMFTKSNFVSSVFVAK